MGNKPLPNPRPFVKLTDGTKIEATSVEEHLKRIQADGTGYKKSEVKSYSDGVNTYMITPKKAVAERVFEGKLNVYRYSFMYTTTSYSPNGSPRTSTHQHIEEYFEKSGTDSFSKVSYKNLAMVIKPQMPSYKYMVASKHNKRLGTYKKLAMIGAVIGGVALLSNSVDNAKVNGAMALAGATLLFPGTFYLFISGTINKAKSKRNLQEAIGNYNGVYPVKKHTR